MPDRMPARTALQRLEDQRNVLNRRKERTEGRIERQRNEMATANSHLNVIDRELAVLNHAVEQLKPPAETDPDVTPDAGE